VADDHAKGAHTHLVEFPEALEAFFSRVGELRAVLGPGGAEGVTRLEALIGEGLAARDRGDAAGAIARIVEAMDLLAELASRADSAEGPLLRAMALEFRAALARGSMSEAKGHAEVMRERSGSVLHPRKP
jgi:hypothetical protein